MYCCLIGNFRVVHFIVFAGQYHDRDLKFLGVLIAELSLMHNLSTKICGWISIGHCSFEISFSLWSTSSNSLIKTIFIVPYFQPGVLWCSKYVHSAKSKFLPDHTHNWSNCLSLRMQKTGTTIDGWSKVLWSPVLGGFTPNFAIRLWWIIWTDYENWLWLNIHNPSDSKSNTWSSFLARWCWL
jgi:hypothetical protein